MTINFDMDGTIADLYAVENWLADLRNYSVRPYAEAEPLLPMRLLSYMLSFVHRCGHTVNIISWGSKVATPAYDDAVAFAKRKWLAEQLPNFTFDNVFIVPYGTPKSSLASGILFDDEAQNRTEWEQTAGNTAFTPADIFKVLANLPYTA